MVISGARDVGFAAGCAAALYVAVASTIKFADLDEFWRQLRTWSLVPDSALPLLVVGVPLIELVLSACWLTGLRRDAARLALTSLLVVFTIAMLLHLVFAEPPDCGCFGKIKLFEDQRAAAWFGIGRNALLIVMINAGWLARRLGVGGVDVGRSCTASA